MYRLLLFIPIMLLISGCGQYIESEPSRQTNTVKDYNYEVEVASVCGGYVEQNKRYVAEELLQLTTEQQYQYQGVEITGTVIEGAIQMPVVTVNLITISVSNKNIKQTVRINTTNTPIYYVLTYNTNTCELTTVERVLHER